MQEQITFTKLNTNMDTILEFIRCALKKDTVNPNQDLANLQDCDIKFINEELRKLREIEENGRSLDPSEEDRSHMLWVEKINRSFTTEEVRNKAAKRDQYVANLRKKVKENPSPFKEDQWVRLKTSSLPRIPDGSEGVILDVLSPDFDLYVEEGIFMHKYLLEVHAENPETSQITGSAVWTVDEDQLKRIRFS